MSNFDWSNPIVKQVCERYITLNRKATLDDATASHKVRDTALYYAETYEGTFSFMLSMKRNVAQFNKLPLERVPGVINCMMHEYKQLRAEDKADSLAYAKDYGDSSAIQQHYVEFKYPTETLPNLPAEIAAHKAQETASATQASKSISIKEVAIKAVCSRCGVLGDVTYDTSLTALCVDTASCMARYSAPVTPQCKNGTYTVVLDETGTYRTIKLSDVPANYNKPEGTQIASYLSGSDNETAYTGFAFVSGTKFVMWKSLTEKSSAPLRKALNVLLSSDKETQIDMGHAYAIESGNCFFCGRKLTVPASVARGLGPICAEKY